MTGYRSRVVRRVEQWTCWLFCTLWTLDKLILFCVFHRWNKSKTSLISHTVQLACSLKCYFLLFCCWAVHRCKVGYVWHERPSKHCTGCPCVLRKPRPSLSRWRQLLLAVPTPRMQQPTDCASGRPMRLFPDAATGATKEREDSALVENVGN